MVFLPDLSAGYRQVEVEPEDRQKTAFTTRRGLFEFNVMPFGLCIAPATFERLMELVLSGLCLIYLDDIIIFGKTFAEMIKNLDLVLERLKPPSIFILTVQRRYFCCGSLLFLLSVFILWFSYYVSDIFCKF